MEKSKTYKDNEISNCNMENIHNYAKLIISHIAKFDTDKVKIFIEDLRLFFNVHNHPEIKIIGRNLPNNTSQVKRKNKCPIQDQEFLDNDSTINKNNYSKFNTDKSRSLKESELNLSQTIDSDYLNNRKKKSKDNIFQNNYYNDQDKHLKNSPCRITVNKTNENENTYHSNKNINISNRREADFGRLNTHGENLFNQNSNTIIKSNKKDKNNLSKVRLPRETLRNSNKDNTIDFSIVRTEEYLSYKENRKNKNILNNDNILITEYSNNDKIFNETDANEKKKPLSKKDQNNRSSKVIDNFQRREFKSKHKCAHSTNKRLVDDDIYNNNDSLEIRDIDCISKARNSSNYKNSKIDTESNKQNINKKKGNIYFKYNFSYLKYF